MFAALLPNPVVFAELIYLIMIKIDNKRGRDNRLTSVNKELALLFVSVGLWPMYCIVSRLPDIFHLIQSVGVPNTQPNY